VVSERKLIERIRRKLGPRRSSQLILGIGDDCAIFRPPGAREDLLFTTDLLIEKVHFRRHTHRAEDAGWKALARGLSDIAAMGGEPRFCLLSLALPEWADMAWVNAFYRGLLLLARRTGVTLAGGDLARSALVACDIVVCGSAPRGKALRRDGARAGHGVYVSGQLGGSALALSQPPGALTAVAWRRHLRPEPRLALGRFLRDRLKASAAMDLSDGLSIDLARLCEASRVSAAIVPPPCFPGASLEQALHGGEDYELLFTVAPNTEVPAAFQGVPLTRIGSIRSGVAGRVFLNGAPLEPLGYDHFRRRMKT
jgi:thiamine-monophosphate kinase